MDKCYKLTALLLVCLVAVVESSLPTNDKGAIKYNKKTLDLRLVLLSDTVCNVTSKTQSENSEITIKCNEKEISCQITFLDADSNRASNWSSWTDCKEPEGIVGGHSYGDVTSTSGEQTCCLPIDISLTNKNGCTLYTGYWSDWSDWSEFTSSEERYRQRSFNCSSNQSVCLIPSNTSSFEIRKCMPDPVSSAQCRRKVNIKKDEKCYTLTEIILVAFLCLILGILLATLSHMLYMKRARKGWFSRHVKECQGDSKQQSGPNLQLLTDRVVVKKYDPKNSNSTDSKNENESEETQYQSLNSNHVEIDQQIYDELSVMEPRYDRLANQPCSSRIKQTDNDEQINHTTNLQHKTEGIYEYSRDSDLHNYFILESENISRASKARNIGRPETYAEEDLEVKDSNLGTEDEQPDAAHEYFVLEHVENGHNQY